MHQYTHQNVLTEEEQISRVIVSAGDISRFNYCPFQVYHRIHGTEGKEMSHHRRGDRKHEEVTVALEIEKPVVLETKEFIDDAKPVTEEKNIRTEEKRSHIIDIESELAEKFVTFDRVMLSEKTLSRKYMMVGTPDFQMVYEFAEYPGFIVPIEMKTGGYPMNGIFPAHMLQEAAYCMIVESQPDFNMDELGFGIVYYMRAMKNDRMRSFDMTDEIREKVLETRDEIARMRVNSRDPVKKFPKGKYILPEIRACPGCEYKDPCTLHPSNESATAKQAEHVV